MGSEKQKSGETRVWFFPDGVGPGREKLFLGCAKLTDPSQDFGDLESIECPDPDRFNEFIELDVIQGSIGRPTAGIMQRFSRVDLSPLLAAAKKRCRSDVQTTSGRCTDPQDYSQWDTMMHFNDQRFTNWSAENFGAIESGEQNPTNETGEISAKELFQYKKMSFGEFCAAEIAREIVAVAVCDNAECGDCDSPSDGCQKVFAVQLGTGATPGTLPSVVYSSDAGAICASTDIDTLFSSEPPTDAACVGVYLVVVAPAGGMHIAQSALILAGTETWTEPTAGFVAGNGPAAIKSVNSRTTYIVGLNGYIYFTADPLTGVVVQDAGIATTQDLNDVDAIDTQNAVAVGELNAVVHTTNGGVTWQAVTGPAVGIALNTVAMYDSRTWLVGSAGGVLYLTRDAGVTWTDVTSTIATSGITEIDDIQYANDAVGFIAFQIGISGHIAKTTDGGATWNLLPDFAGNIPANDRINSLAVCSDPNVLYAGGLNDDGTDGILLKAS